MRRHFEGYFLDIITRRERGFLAACLRTLLRLISWPFQLYVNTRNWAFDHGWLRSYYPPVPAVISIGNIVLGGTGKTPVTLMLAESFIDEFSVAILSRGYRSPAEKLPVPIMLSKGQGPLQPAAFCGDEPYLLSQNLPNALIFVGKDRHKASDMAARAGVQLILLDDGMQHRCLARDYEVVVMDMKDPFGQGFHFPRGLLRESKQSLKRASIIILNHVPSSEIFVSMKHQLAHFSNAYVIGTRMEVVQLMDFEGSPLPALRDKKVGIFCGIAHPDYFEQTVMQQGAEIVDSAFAADHMSLKPAVLAKFADECKLKGAELLVCTEKDRVKIADTANLSLPLAWLKMRLNVIEGEPEWKLFIEQVKTDIRRQA
jgi:tetraacyldisaccharide 4'-kinase